MGLIKERIVAKLEQLPEVLKQTVLQNFQIEGTVPITRHEMQEMMRLSISDLKTTIETSLQSIAQRDRGAAPPLVTGAIENRAQAPGPRWLSICGVEVGRAESSGTRRV